jgi:CheY-like chemotaxis protein
VGKKILVVDDNRLVLVGVAAVLEAEGFRVWTTDSPVEAVELAGQVRPDVVVTDMRMPSMDGISLLERLKDVTPEKPQMLIYSATMPPAADRVRDRMPGVTWVSKTADHQALLDVLEAP